MNEWICVRDQMPENNERVLAYCKDLCVHDVVWERLDSAWFDRVTGGIYMESFVTHWASFQKPTKGSSTKDGKENDKT